MKYVLALLTIVILLTSGCVPAAVKYAQGRNPGLQSHGVTAHWLSDDRADTMSWTRPEDRNVYGAMKHMQKTAAQISDEIPSWLARNPSGHL